MFSPCCQCGAEGRAPAPPASELVGRFSVQGLVKAGELLFAAHADGAETADELQDEPAHAERPDGHDGYAEELDEELLSWIKTAYAFADAK